MNDEKYVLVLIDTDSGLRYFWTGESFSQKEEGALKMPSGNDFKLYEINKMASGQFPNCRTFVFRESPRYIGSSSEFKNGLKIGLSM